MLSRARSLLGLPGGPRDRLGPREIDRAARAVMALHDGLVGARSLARPETYDERLHLGAYLLWWWPQSYAKVGAALRLLPAGLLQRGRILDLGAGPGPAALAALDFLGEGEAVLVDASGAALDEAKALADGEPLALRLWKLDAAALPLPAGERYQLICAANVLSELPGGPAERAQLLQRICDEHLAPRGTLLLVEPALRETGRALLEVRDLLLQRGLHASAPCLTQRPCPALAFSKDWCTAEERWLPPPHVVQLAQATGLRADQLLSFAPLALSREAPPAVPDLFRVVGVAPPEKGKARVFVCNDEHGRAAAGLLDRDRSESNAAITSLRRGDLVTLRGLAPKGDGLRLGKDSVVRKG